MKKLLSVLAVLGLTASGSVAAAVCSTKTQKEYKTVNVQDDGTVNFEASNIFMPTYKNLAANVADGKVFSVFNKDRKIIDTKITSLNSSLEIKPRQKCDLNVSFKVPDYDQNNYKPQVFNFSSVDNKGKEGNLLFKIKVEGGSAVIIPMTPDDKKAEASANELINKVTPKDATKSYKAVTNLSTQAWDQAYIQAAKDKNVSFAMSDKANDIDEKYLPDSIRKLDIDHVAKVTAARLFGRLKGTALGTSPLVDKADTNLPGYDVNKLKEIWDNCVGMGAECKNTLGNLYETAVNLTKQRDETANSKTDETEKLIYSLLPIGTMPKEFSILVSSNKDELVKATADAVNKLSVNKDKVDGLKQANSSADETNWMKKYSANDRNEIYKELLTAKTAAFISSTFYNDAENQKTFKDLSSLTIDSNDYELGLNNVLFNDSFIEFVSNYDNYKATPTPQPKVVKFGTASYKLHADSIELTGENLDAQKDWDLSKFLGLQNSESSIKSVTNVTENKMTLNLDKPISEQEKPMSYSISYGDMKSSSFSVKAKAKFIGISRNENTIKITGENFLTDDQSKVSVISSLSQKDIATNTIVKSSNEIDVDIKPEPVKYYETEVLNVKASNDLVDWTDNSLKIVNTNVPSFDKEAKYDDQSKTITITGNNFAELDKLSLSNLSIKGLSNDKISSIKLSDDNKQITITLKDYIDETNKKVSYDVEYNDQHGNIFKSSFTVYGMVHLTSTAYDSDKTVTIGADNLSEVDVNRISTADYWMVSGPKYIDSVPDTFKYGVDKVSVNVKDKTISLHLKDKIDIIKGNNATAVEHNIIFAQFTDKIISKSSNKSDDLSVSIETLPPVWTSVKVEASGGPYLIISGDYLDNADWEGNFTISGGDLNNASAELLDEPSIKDGNLVINISGNQIGGDDDETYTLTYKGKDNSGKDLTLSISFTYGPNTPEHKGN